MCAGAFAPLRSLFRFDLFFGDQITEEQIQQITTEHDREVQHAAHNRHGKRSLSGEHFLHHEVHENDGDEQLEGKGCVIHFDPPVVSSYRHPTWASGTPDSFPRSPFSGIPATTTLQLPGSRSDRRCTGPSFRWPVET